MPETIHCPQCARELRVPESLLGKKVKCPGCSTTFTAPVPTPGLPGEGYEAAAAPADAPPPLGGVEMPHSPPLTGDRPKEIDWMAYMALGGGALACFVPLVACAGLIGSFFTSQRNYAFLCCFPFEIYSLVVGVLSILTGMKLRRPDAYSQAPPAVNAYMRLANILVCDWINALMAGITLYWLKSNPAVQAYFRGGAAPTEPAPEA